MNHRPLKLSPSRWLSAILLLIGLVAALSVWFLLFSWWVKVLATCAIAYYTWHALYRFAWLRHPHAWLGMRLGERQQLFALTRAGEVAMRLHADTVVTPFFVLLRMRLANQQSLATMVIMKDSCPQQEFRRWRVWLLWGIRRQQLDISE